MLVVWSSPVSSSPVRHLRPDACDGPTATRSLDRCPGGYLWILVSAPTQKGLIQ
jgi:hypothetical protein